MEIGLNKREGKYNEIILLHLIGAVMILLRHFFQGYNDTIGEFFISGVFLFLFVAGFLAGLKPKVNGKWLLSRVKRIYTPYYLFFIPCLLALYLTSRDLVTLRQWIFLLTNIQGETYIYFGQDFYGAVIGTGHLWYTTIIMLCYLLTPLLYKIIDKFNFSKTIWLIIGICLVIVIQPLTLLIKIQSGYIITFVLGLIVARVGVKINGKNFIVVSVACVALVLVRLIARHYLDGSEIYIRYIALLANGAIGIWIFYFVFWLSLKLPKMVNGLAKNKVIAYLSEISYEIYLTHVWFWSGYWKVGNYISNIFIAYIVIVIISVIVSIILHTVSKLVIRLIDKAFSK